SHTENPEFYTLSLHDALPIWGLSKMMLKEVLLCFFVAFSIYPCYGQIADENRQEFIPKNALQASAGFIGLRGAYHITYERLIVRSEEHTSELQSRENLVCRLL